VKLGYVRGVAGFVAISIAVKMLNGVKFGHKTRRINMAATTHTTTRHDTKRSEPVKRAARGVSKQAKPTKWGAQLLVKMEALRKALAAQA
jgi:maltooligosyltrehalose synthase